MKSLSGLIVIILFILTAACSDNLKLVGNPLRKSIPEDEVTEEQGSSLPKTEKTSDGLSSPKNDMALQLTAKHCSPLPRGAAYHINNVKLDDTKITQIEIKSKYESVVFHDTELFTLTLVASADNLTTGLCIVAPNAGTNANDIAFSGAVTLTQFDIVADGDRTSISFSAKSANTWKFVKPRLVVNGLNATVEIVERGIPCPDLPANAADIRFELVCPPPALR